MLADVIGEDLAVLFCGINPGAEAARVGHHFVGRSNRFWRVLHLAGFTPVQIQAADDHSLLGFGYGLTTVVPRATRRADEVSHAEFLGAATAFEQKVLAFGPAYVAFLGKAAYGAITGARVVAWGRQAAAFGGAVAWVLPNPSGLNRGFSLDRLVSHYRDLRLQLDAG